MIEAIANFHDCELRTIYQNGIHIGHAELHNYPSEWRFRQLRGATLSANQLQQIADKLRELNGGATDGQENEGH